MTEESAAAWTAPMPPPRPVSDAELAFLSTYTGIADLAELREHLLTTWNKAVSGGRTYKCVQECMFLQPRVPRLPWASELLRRDESGGLWMDLGCAFGTDVRWVQQQGWPRDATVAVDVVDTFWQLGLQLFRDADRQPCRFFQANIIDDAVFPPVEVATTSGNKGSRGVGSLRHSCAVVSAMAVLHVLTKAEVEALLRKAALLLLPGGQGTLSGVTGGSATPCEWPVADKVRFLHSQASLKALLEALGYQDVQVQEASSTSAETGAAGGHTRPLAEGVAGAGSSSSARDAAWSRTTVDGTPLDFRLLAFRGRSPASATV